MVRRGVQVVRERSSTIGCGSWPVVPSRCRSPDETFDAVTFTYLFRYVDDPATTVAELVRVLRPGGVMASLEFHVPRAAVGCVRVGTRTRPSGDARDRLGRSRPGGIGPGGSSGPSIERVRPALPAPRAGALVAGGGHAPRADEADLERRRRRDVGRQGQSAARWRRSLARSAPAFYALAPGGWRDYWTLLHPPYTVWHLSYVVIGASLAPEVNAAMAARDARGVLPRDGRRGARARRAARASAANPHPRPRVDRASRWWGSRARSRSASHGTLEVSTWLWAFIGDRRVPRRRVQPRALRWSVPLRRVVRARVGRLPGAHRLLRADGDRDGRSGHRRGGVRGDERGPAGALDAGPTTCGGG